MTSLILSEIKDIKLNQRDDFIVFEQYYKDFYIKKIEKKKLKILNPNIIKKDDKNNSYIFCGEIYEKILKDIVELNKLQIVT